jgi:hypothetical protein
MVCGARMGEILSSGFALEKKYKLTEEMIPMKRL